VVEGLVEVFVKVPLAKGPLEVDVLVPGPIAKKRLDKITATARTAAEPKTR